MTKRTRKPNLHSSIYLGKDGNWHGRVWVGYRDDGEPDRRHVMSKDEAVVRRKVRKLERERDTGNLAKAGRAPTVEEWMRTYLDTIAIRTLAPKTLYDYERICANWIFPNIGGQRLHRLEAEHLDSLYVKMAKAGKASSHILKVHRIISRALEIGVRRGKVGRNVAKLIDAPTVTQIEIQPFDEEESRRILKAAFNRVNGHRWAIGLALGLRQGEALGLRWEYVDLEKRSARIFWQIQRGKWRHGCKNTHACGLTSGKNGKCLHRFDACAAGCKRHATYKRGCPPPCPADCVGHASTCPERQSGGLVFRPPKGKSKRVVPIPAQLVNMLREQQTRQAEDRLRAGTVWEEHDVIFSQPTGRPIDPRDDWDDWKDLLRAAGVRDARVHDGRHTAGTLLLEQGVSLRVVQEFLGHSDSRVTERYTHVASRLAEDASDRLGSVLFLEK